MRTVMRPLRAVLLSAFAAAVVAMTPAVPALAALTAEERNDIQRIERYWNAVRTLQADFLQISPDGQEERGTLYLKRPGRLRVEYKPPSPILIVANGKWLTYYDAELNSVNNIRLEDTPASLLVRDRLEIGKQVVVTDFRRGPGVLRVTLADRRAMEAGRLILTFTDSPLRLRKWTVIDAQGEHTSVALQDVHLGVDLEPRLFILTAPTVGRSEG